MGTVTVNGGTATPRVTIYAESTVVGGSSSDKINIVGNAPSGTISMGKGSDTIYVAGSGKINLGTGSDTIKVSAGSEHLHDAGSATVIGAFGKATISGGHLSEHESKGIFDATSKDGAATLLGGGSQVTFTAGSSSNWMKGNAGADTFIGGASFDTMTGGKGGNLFEFLQKGAGGTAVITNFVHGSDKLYLEGYSLNKLPTGDSSSYSRATGLTTIKLDGGATVITVNGKITGSDITTHK